MAPSLHAHIWSAELSWRGEEVGADWHMTDRMWLEGVQKEEEHFSVKCELIILFFLFPYRTILSQ